MSTRRNKRHRAAKEHEVPEDSHAHDTSAHGGTLALALGAVGIVFGDIGTSPLYTFRECLASIHEHSGQAATRDDVFGLLSMLFWSLTFVVTVKYVAFVLRAEHKGEGGIFALLGMVPERYRPTSPSRFGWVPILVVIGAALLYGDGVITPAISVLSAVEGLKLARPELAPYTVQITCLILIGLFAIQRRGTATVGKLFGPIMVLWFCVLAGLGIYHIASHPSVLVAVSPTYAIGYFAHHGLSGTSILASVVLAVTGGEALYADMGHFGRAPIRLAWLAFVWPALVLCYFGQGAMVLSDPQTMVNPFFEMAPRSTLVPLVILSSTATVIASQALISGAYSLTRQAIQLGFLPRLAVKHTSEDTEGQIYMPQLNWILASACLFIVVLFGSSSRLAAAYGLAVTGSMAITSVVFGLVAVTVLEWPKLPTIALVGCFLCFDIPFFIANAAKFSDGGWLPALIGAGLTALMLLWARGRRLIRDLLFGKAPQLMESLPAIRAGCVATLPGTAVMMAASDTVVPPVLTQLVERFKVLHERIVVLTVLTDDTAYVSRSQRGTVRDLGDNVFHAVLHFGFMEIQDVPKNLARVLRKAKAPVAEETLLYFLRREHVVAGAGGQMDPFAESIFAFMHRNATPADSYFCLPPERVVELGWQLDL